jgi:hypothetical protein
MNVLFGMVLVLIGFALIATREWSARLHEKWNWQFAWTLWATGPRAMAASRICNVVVGAAFVIIGLALQLTP